MNGSGTGKTEVDGTEIKKKEILFAVNRLFYLFHFGGNGKSE